MSLITRSCTSCDVTMFVKQNDKKKLLCHNCYDELVRIAGQSDASLHDAPQQKNLFKLECISCKGHFESKYLSKSCTPCYQAWKSRQPA